MFKVLASHVPLGDVDAYGVYATIPASLLSTLGFDGDHRGYNCAPEAVSDVAA